MDTIVSEQATVILSICGLAQKIGNLQNAPPGVTKFSSQRLTSSGTVKQSDWIGPKICAGHDEIV